jgi:pimeloyl-ACP methyl ester carboxylesterase
MGGGAALLAAGRHGDVDCVAALAAIDTRPSAIEACRRLHSPALFVVGSEDRVVVPSRSRRLHDALPGPAAWASVMGGYHCGFLESSTLGGLGCDSGSIPRSRQLDLVATLLGDWFDETLKEAPPLSVRHGVSIERRS